VRAFVVALGSLVLAPAPARAEPSPYQRALKACQARRAELARLKGRAVVVKRKVEVGGFDWRPILVRPRLCLAGISLSSFRRSGSALPALLRRFSRRHAQRLTRCSAGLKRAPRSLAWIKLTVDRAGRVTRWTTSGDKALRRQARCVGRVLSGFGGERPVGEGGVVALSLVALD
jgi:hypothetical protein